MTKDSQRPGSVPEPEALSTQTAESVKAKNALGAHDKPKMETAASTARRPLSRLAYRPSHKATFLGVLVVSVILIINVAVIFFMMNSQKNADASAEASTVTLSSETLSTLGVDRNPVGDINEELVVGPDSRFKGAVSVADALEVSGSVTLNAGLTAQNASLVNLQAGNTSLNSLTVNGDGSFNNATVRSSLGIGGTLQVQGQANFANNIAVSGNLAVGGTLTARTLQLESLSIVHAITLGGHIVTAGGAPSISGGGAVGSNGTVSASGNDVSGTVVVNVGVGASAGVLANLSFRQAFGNTPHVVVSPVGRAASDYYINRTSSGFSINTASPLSPGGYMFDYIVMQ